jgi:phosphatidate cytidylyltransferase
MMRERILTAILLLIVFVVSAAYGGVLYWGLALVTLSLAGWEWTRLFGQRGLTGSLPGVLSLIWIMLLAVLPSSSLSASPDVQLPYVNLLWPGVAVVLILALGQMVIRARQGYSEPATSFSVTLGGGLYLGWMGMHVVMLRQLPDGLYWTLIVLPAAFAADTAAYVFGQVLGRHKMAPRISPGKTWEGYVAGVVGALVVSGLLAALWSTLDVRCTFADGAVIGLLGGGLSVLGDLGVSAFKRQMGVKDTGKLLPGHGGMLDRLDTVLVTGVIGYYYVLWFAGA